MRALPRRSTTLTLVSLIMLVIAITNGLCIYLATARIRHDAKTVNHAGIVRGSIQRMAKLALAGKDVSAVTREIDRTLGEFDRERNALELYLRGQRFAGLRRELTEEWTRLQAAVAALNADGRPENRARVVESSEQCWKTANDLVFEIQRISESKISLFYLVLAMAGIDILIVAASIILIRKHVRNELEFLANHDPLTSLYNRHSYKLLLEQELRRIKRLDSTLSLMLLDIDRFKAVNDKFGHDQGDRVLREIAKTVSNAIRRSDALFRIGGEEFAVIVPDADLSQAALLAEKVRTAVFGIALDGVGTVSVSIGIAETTEDDDVDRLFKRADAALYAAKASGRNCIAVPPS